SRQLLRRRFHLHAPRADDVENVAATQKTQLATLLIAELEYEFRNALFLRHVLCGLGRPARALGIFSHHLLEQLSCRASRLGVPAYAIMKTPRLFFFLVTTAVRMILDDSLEAGQQLRARHLWIVNRAHSLLQQ